MIFVLKLMFLQVFQFQDDSWQTGDHSEEPHRAFVNFCPHDDLRHICSRQSRNEISDEVNKLYRYKLPILVYFVDPL